MNLAETSVIRETVDLISGEYLNAEDQLSSFQQTVKNKLKEQSKTIRSLEAGRQLRVQNWLRQPSEKSIGHCNEEN